MMWLVDTDCTFRVSWEPDGTATDVGDVTITVTRANGTALFTDDSTVNNADGTYDYTLDASDNDQLDRLRLEWTRVSTGETVTVYEEIVGGFVFSESQARSFGDLMLSTGNVNPSDQDVVDSRDRITEYLESETQRSWISRHNRVELPGTGRNDLNIRDGMSRDSAGDPLHRPGSGRDVQRVIAASVGGVAVSTANLQAHRDGTIIRTDGNWPLPTNTDPNNIVVEYAYGLPTPVDGVDRIAMMIARHQLVASRHPDNALSFSDPLASYQFDQTRLPSEAYHWIKARKTGVFFG